MADPPPNSAPPAAAHWPCGPDCVFAEPMPHTYGEWFWCHRPGTDQRLVRAGRDCTCFQPPAYVGETPEAAARRTK